MYAVVFDTETSGFVKRVGDRLVPPHLVQLAWQRVILTKGQPMRVLEKHNYICKPQGDAHWSMRAQDVHKISQEHAMRVGVDAGEALQKFQASVSGAHVSIAHNVGFDVNIIDSVFMKLRCEKFRWRETYCTALNTKNLVNAMGKRGIKMPKLVELYTHLHGAGTDFKFHDAGDDTQCLLDCVEELFKRNHMAVAHNVTTSVYFPHQGGDWKIF